MTQVHGKDTYVSLNATDLSAYTNNTQWKRAAKAHETSTYGTSDEKYKGGLRGGTVTISGVYESGASGPSAVIEPLLGTVVEFIFRAEGTGTGKPQKTVNVLVVSYDQTNPVSDMIAWTATLQLSGAVTPTTQ